MAQKFGFMGPIFYTPTKVAPINTYIKFRVNPVEMFQENKQKPIYWPSLAQFR